MIQDSNPHAVLYTAIELGSTQWVLAFTTELGGKTRKRWIPAKNLLKLAAEIREAKRYFRLPEDAVVCSWYEAGRDGFWLHRSLEELGVKSHGVDSASLEVSRRQRQLKTDRLDAKRLLRQLIRYCRGDYDDGDPRCRVLRVPDELEEDERRVPREMKTLKQERTTHVNRIQSLLNLKGIRGVKINQQLAGRLRDLAGPGGHRLHSHERQQIERELQRLQGVDQQIQQIQRERQRRLRVENSRQIRMIRTLLALRGIGIESAWLLVTEIFGWRKFRNRREVGAFSGLTATLYGSDQTVREQGISKAGNPRVRAMMIEIAWKWLEYQPQSELSQWYRQRFGGASSRTRRNGIVALARKLLVSLWKYLEWGEVPAGATFSELPS